MRGPGCLLQQPRQRLPAASPLPPTHPNHTRLRTAVVTWQGLSSLDAALPPLSDAAIAAQLAVLNADYSGTGLQFAAPTVHRHEQANWTANCWNALPEILAAVNTAPTASVNVLVCDLAGSAGILGCALLIQCCAVPRRCRRAALPCLHPGPAHLLHPCGSPPALVPPPCR